MIPTVIGFRAFDPHELLVHAVALRTGLYRDAGISPQLVDLSSLERPEHDPGIVTVACGAAALARASGARISTLVAACVVPMFWLCALAETSPGGVTAGARIAGYPHASPPAGFLRRALAALGLRSERDVAIAAVRDDASRRGLLRTGDADLALLSSASLPFEEFGMRPVLDVGETLGAPSISTGLAVADELASRDASRVRALVAVHREALALIHRDSATAQQALLDPLGASPAILGLVRSRLSVDGLPHVAGAPGDGDRRDAERIA